MTGFQLAQVNIGRILGPMDSAVMVDFANALDEINALADGSPGFVWRLQDDDGNATGLRPFDDDSLLINMSVWESIEALEAYVYRSHHRDYLVRRREWFARMTEVFVALWWVPAGTIPTEQDAKDHLALLAEHGPTADTFTFRKPFPAPESVAATGAIAPGKR